MKTVHLTLMGLLLTMAACKTTEPVVDNRIVITPQTVDTCTPISALERVVVPAVTQKYFAITEIDNPPYEPITRTEELTREVEPERVMYVDSEGREVTNLCDTQGESGF